MVNGTFARWATWLWPGRCLSCGASTARREHWCPPCYAVLPWIAHACTHCAAPLTDVSSAVCGACQRSAPPFAHAVAALRYSAPIDRLIVALKFHQRLDLAPALAQLLVRRLRRSAAERPDLLVPVPLHRARLRERGYNQSLELARIVGAQLAVAVDPHAAVRRRATAPQISLPKPERKRNVRNAFAVRATVEGLHVGILDDVMTTGHTAAALATALRRAGARQVSVWTLARA